MSLWMVHFGDKVFQIYTRLPRQARRQITSGRWSFYHSKLYVLQSWCRQRVRSNAGYLASNKGLCCGASGTWSEGTYLRRKPQFLLGRSCLIKLVLTQGSYDWICNHVGNERWTLALEWSGHSEFASKELRDWLVDGKPAGHTRSAGGFTFATITGAGHMVRPFISN